MSDRNIATTMRIPEGIAIADSTSMRTTADWLGISPSAENWLLVDAQFDLRRLAHFETLFTLSNGYAGVRGSLEVSPLLAHPGCYVAGVYDQVVGHAQEIVNLPCFLGIDANLDGFGIDLRKGEVLAYRRILDLRQGLLFTDFVWENEIHQQFRWESVRLMHQTEKHVHLLCGRITALTHGGTLTLSTRIDAWAVKHGSYSGGTRYGQIIPTTLEGEGIGLTITTRSTGIRVAEASHLVVPGTDGYAVAQDDDRISGMHQLTLAVGESITFEQWTAVATSRDTDNPETAVQAAVARGRAMGTQQFILSHVGAWAAHWHVADVIIEGDDRIQHALRVNLFHLLSLANPGDDRVSLGAKGLHGNGYCGLVFWDTEIYLLPFFAYTDPSVARALLRYRHHLLPDARANAQALGYRGARFPWTSGSSGREDPWIGWQEHVGADIAYAVDQYVRATGDQEFFLHVGAELIIATAQYYASRIEYDPAKGYVMRNLMGPDEIHGGIENNTFTNYLLKWHLARAVDAVAALRAIGRWEQLAIQYALTDAEVASWQVMSDGMYVNFSTECGFHEQFDGYFQLPEGVIDRRMTKQQYTGPVQHSFRPTKVAQQADTLLIYHLFPGDFPRDVLAKAYQYYEPRCTHTSTLSRSVFATVAARAGLVDDAYQQYLTSIETDLGPTAECDSGIHAACLGGNWQAVVLGFAGFSVQAGRPCFHPRVPLHWQRLTFTLRWQGDVLAVSVTPEEMTLRTEVGALEIEVCGQIYCVTPQSQTIPLCKDA